MPADKPGGRGFRPVALAVSAAVIALAVFFLVRGAWWTSAGLVALWLGAEWYGVWKDRRRREQRRSGG